MDRSAAESRVSVAPAKARQAGAAAPRLWTRRRARSRGQGLRRERVRAAQHADRRPAARRSASGRPCAPPILRWHAPEAPERLAAGSRATSAFRLGPSPFVARSKAASTEAFPSPRPTAPALHAADGLARVGWLPPRLAVPAAPGRNATLPLGLTRRESTAHVRDPPGGPVPRPRPAPRSARPTPLDSGTRSGRGAGRAAPGR